MGLYKRLLVDSFVRMLELAVTAMRKRTFRKEERFVSDASYSPRSERFIMIEIRRLIDITLASALLVLLAPLCVLIALLVKLSSRGPALYWSDRVGANNRIFRMPKFRSMRVGTPQVATHLLSGASAHLSPIGGLLRRSSLDELPQLWSILRGDLTFVGPRPALFNQHDLVALRTKWNVHTLSPGLTGWAQINGRDELSIPAKVEFDKEYLQRRSIRFDCMILVKTAGKILLREGIRH